MFSAAALLIGLGLGIWLKSWHLVVVLVVVGLLLSIVGWQADWFSDEDTPALGGALLFELFICAPLAVGAGLGVYLLRSSARRKGDGGSTLPIEPPSDARRR